MLEMNSGNDEILIFLFFSPEVLFAMVTKKVLKAIESKYRNRIKINLYLSIDDGHAFSLFEDQASVLPAEAAILVSEFHQALSDYANENAVIKFLSCNPKY